jgi:hypothetical protein
VTLGQLPYVIFTVRAGSMLAELPLEEALDWRAAIPLFLLALAQLLPPLVVKAWKRWRAQQEEGKEGKEALDGAGSVSSSGPQKNISVGAGIAEGEVLLKEDPEAGFRGNSNSNSGGEEEKSTKKGGRERTRA